ncbi:MAG: T9SS type A sorting domain-containing protein [Psychroflexus maritimus]
MIKKLFKSAVLLTAILLWVSGIQAQESIHTSGGDATGSGGSAAYSIGQVVYTTNTGSSGSVAQGVQQAYEIFSLDVKEVRSSISLEVFPNPTTNNLTLQISEYNNEEYSYLLYDMFGKALSKGQITSQRTQINTSGLPSATYIIHIRNKAKQNVKSFKIIKTQ